MKLLLFVFAVMLVVVLVVGCDARREKKEFDTDRVTTVVTPAEETGESSPLSVTASEASKTGSLRITNLQNDHLDTNKGYEVITGAAPEGTHKIKVNNYTLQRYRPGQKAWIYLAATRFSTLKKGDNAYTVFALDRAGNEIDRTTFTIAYNPMMAPALPNSGNPLTLSLAMASFLCLGWYGLKRMRA